MMLGRGSKMMKMFKYSLMGTLTATTMTSAGLEYLHRQDLIEKSKILDNYPMVNPLLDSYAHQRSKALAKLEELKNESVDQFNGFRQLFRQQFREQQRDVQDTDDKSSTMELKTGVNESGESASSQPTSDNLVSINASVEQAKDAVNRALVNYYRFTNFIVAVLEGKEAKVPTEFIEALEQCNKLLNSLPANDPEYTSLRHEVARLRNLVDFRSIVKQFKSEVERMRSEFQREVGLINTMDQSRDITDSILLVHAHRQIHGLQRRLSEHRVLQKTQLEKMLKEKVDSRIHDIRRQVTVQVEKQHEAENEHRLGVELERYARVLEERHSANLARERAKYEADSEKRIERMRAEETRYVYEQLSLQEAKLAVLHSALTSQMEAESKAQGSQQVWIECSSLVDALLQRSDRLDGLAIIRRLGNCPARSVATDQISDKLAYHLAEKTMDSEQDLVNKFHVSTAVADKLMDINENNRTFSNFVYSWCHSVWRRLSGHTRVVHLTRDSLIDLDNADNLYVLAVANGFICSGDMLSALKMLSLLKGEPSKAFREWKHDAEHYLTIKQHVNVLLSMATAGCLKNMPIKQVLDMDGERK